MRNQDVAFPIPVYLELRTAPIVLSEQIILRTSCQTSEIVAVYVQFILQVTKDPRENRRVMDIDYDIILEQSHRLYGVLPLRDTRTGHLESFQSIRSRM